MLNKQRHVLNRKLDQKSKSSIFPISKDLTQARDEVGKSIQAIEQSGIRVEQRDKEHDDYYEIKIKIYKNR